MPADDADSTDTSASPAARGGAPSPLVARMRGFGTSVFTEMTQNALRYDAVNLGQGFPDTEPAQDLRAAAIAAVEGGANQYAPARGVPVLREAVAEHQRTFYGIDVDPDSEVLVTVGATEGVSAAVLALVEPGDEVVVLEPYYDSYAAAIALAGGVRRTVPLTFPGLELDEAALRAAFGPRTRLLLLNSPHNPTGKVLTRAELELVARVAREHDVLVVTDEVYEHLTFDDRPHVPIATLPGMAERTLTVSSGGKTFSATGWKVGWVHGPAELVSAVAAVKQFLTFVASGPFQHAVAVGLAKPRSFFTDLAADLQRKRDLISEALDSAGLQVLPSQGTYFVVADVAPLGEPDALDLCRRMPAEVGVVGVPISAFVDDPEPVRSLVRFSFAKRPEVLQEAARRLAGLGR